MSLSTARTAMTSMIQSLDSTEDLADCALRRSRLILLKKYLYNSIFYKYFLNNFSLLRHNAQSVKPPAEADGCTIEVDAVLTVLQGRVNIFMCVRGTINQQPAVSAWLLFLLSACYTALHVRIML